VHRHSTVNCLVSATICRELLSGVHGCEDRDRGSDSQVVGPLSYHLGQVVMRTRMRTGHEFHFVRAGVNEAQLRELLNRRK